MKNKNLLWIFLIVLGGIFMIIGSAIGSAYFYQFLYTNLAVPYAAPEFLPLIQSILKALEYIAFFGGYSVLVGAFFLLIILLIKWVRVGKIIIMIATSFGMLGLIIYALTWAVGYFSISLNPSLQLILAQIYSLFTFNSGIGFTGTVLAVFGRFGVKRSEKAEKDSSTSNEKSKISSDSKACPSCGASLPLKANFCNKCGTNF